MSSRVDSNARRDGGTLIDTNLHELTKLAEIEAHFKTPERKQGTDGRVAPLAYASGLKRSRATHGLVAEHFFELGDVVVDDVPQ